MRSSQVVRASDRLKWQQSWVRSPASSDTVESEGREMKKCRIMYYKKPRNKVKRDLAALQFHQGRCAAPFSTFSWVSSLCISFSVSPLSHYSNCKKTWCALNRNAEGKGCCISSCMSNVLFEECINLPPPPLSPTLIKKKIKFFSYIRKFTVEQLQSHISTRFLI